MRECQHGLHDWGCANQVTFDPSKEGMHIVARGSNSEECFGILGVDFDTRLLMRTAVQTVVNEAKWRARAILRSRRYHSVEDMIALYKANVLSYIEYRTAALYHAEEGVLEKLDSIQKCFIQEVGVNALDALQVFNLAPLSTRRDIAMLGILQKVSWKTAPAQLCSLFELEVISGGKHDRRMKPFRSGAGDDWGPLRRSIFGLVDVWNALPQIAVNLASVSEFQSVLQRGVKRAAGNFPDERWKRLLSPRDCLMTCPAEGQDPQCFFV